MAPKSLAPAGYSVKGLGPAVLGVESGGWSPQIAASRQGRCRILRSSVGIGLAVQPDVIASLRDKKGFRGRGLLARFLWAMPESLVGRRDPDPPPVPLEVSQAYEEAITPLLRRPTRRDETGEIKPQPMDFSATAHALVVGLKAKNEGKLGLGGEYEDIADWANKLAGETVRIAGLLQLADHALESDASAPLGVGPDHMRRALRITEYLVTHARIAFDMMGADPIAELDPPLDLLIEHEIIRCRPVPPRSGRGRTPSPTFDVNPQIHSQESQNPESGPPAGKPVESCG